jgi:RNA polymerase sigma-70 factor (ECF subfamily)
MPIGSAKEPHAALEAADPSDAGGRRVTAAEGDAVILTAARSGDRAALARVYERHAPMVHAVLLARVGRGEAEDLVQEVFLRAMSRLDTLRDREAIGPWLAAIARKLTAMEEAKERPDAELEVDDVLGAIRELPEAYRETLMLRLVERMTGPQISERLGLTHGSVRVNLCRGMKMLRERLGLDGAP